ncbi:hypothetical protein BBG47_27685 [Paenibacillus sp. KS1]|uniref:hypothetical protein n=1 Tax=Paenibacillus sp. KS1 TaxID=1849249 RepID=UPI0008065B0A|nr:hypothetical protein [Paenibacillus sp. KS1]OBY76344.1 hypothetical protein BBG47_27685 [Paenibacillus sp. KS1]
MNLVDLEKIFNEAYLFEDVKKESIKTLEELILNSESNYLKEEEEKLPNNMKLKDFIIRYKCTEIFINNHDRIYPFFRVCLELLHPKTQIQQYYFDIEYTIDGEYSDEYFGMY